MKCSNCHVPKQMTEIGEPLGYIYQGHQRSETKTHVCVQGSVFHSNQWEDDDFVYATHIMFVFEIGNKAARISKRHTPFRDVLPVISIRRHFWILSNPEFLAEGTAMQAAWRVLRG